LDELLVQFDISDFGFEIPRFYSLERNIVIRYGATAPAAAASRTRFHSSRHAA
jgi:hypothetical protein